MEIPDYQVTPELIDKLNEYLEVFKGTNNFFNYTIRMDKNDASAKRYIIGFKVSSRPRLSFSASSALCLLHLFQGCNTHACALRCISALDRSPSMAWTSFALRFRARASCCTRSAA